MATDLTTSRLIVRKAAQMIDDEADIKEIISMA